MERSKGVYIVSEKAALQGNTGANQHVNMGFKMLSLHFDMELVTLFPHHGSGKVEQGVKNSVSASKGGVVAKIKKSRLVGAIRDVFLLVKKNIVIINYYKQIRDKQPDFIYERTAYLDYRGLLIARWLRIPHFYENNGIAAFHHHQYYYKSLLAGFTLWLERKAYDLSDHVFYVGTWGMFFNSAKKNWTNVENGIEEEIVAKFREHQKSLDGKLVIGFIGRLMKHHRASVLVEALKNLPDKGKLKVVLIGANLGELENELRGIVECENHGFVGRDQIWKYLADIHIGIIPGSDKYPSHMKLFDYASTKALVICPDTFNLTYWFKDNEVMFFSQDNAGSLQQAIQKVIEQPEIITKLGNALYNKVAEKFTWQEIFNTKAVIIKEHLAGKQKIKP